MIGAILYAVHVMFAVLWVGGMAFAVVALRPSLQTLEPPQRLAVLEGAMKRFFLVVWHAMPVVLLTGWVLLFGWYGGFRGAGWHVHAMHLSGLLMGAVFLAIWTGPWRGFRAAMAAGDRAAAAAQAAKVRALVNVNLGLGTLTVLVASFGSFAR
jgi:uncharacterized membrane protein